MYLKMYGMKLP